MNRKSSGCMDNNVKDNKHTRHIDRRVYLVRNDEKCKVHTIAWCEGGLKLADIETKNVGKNDLNIRIKYIILWIES